ncbi:hypothetical protein, partial [Serratia liquefaciens]|uniref:hypothetical protein n=1 Tax=Serratia liquefaciens TaxID=614 RepID=UPI0021B76022
DLLVGKTLLHGDVLMWLMKTLLTSGCTNQLGAGQVHQHSIQYMKVEFVGYKSEGSRKRWWRSNQQRYFISATVGGSLCCSDPFR